MKALNNPVFVVVLAVVAVGFAAWNVVGPQMKRAKRSGGTTTAATPAVEASSPAAASAAMVTTNDPVGQPILPIDRAVVSAQLREWIDAPGRDPFYGLGAGRVRGPGETNSAAQMLRLAGIWRQTGSQLAVINDRVVAEGERIGDFQIERIESDAVWVRGPQERERLEFVVPPGALVPASTEAIARAGGG
jgi:hypothetical protein